MDERIKLNNDFRIELFDSILSSNNISLRQLSRELGCGYSGLKTWRRGECLIPSDKFDAILKLAGIEKTQIEDKFTKLSSNWGAVLGGTVANNKPKRLIKQKMIHARTFRKSKISLPKINVDVWELLGAFLGDGCLSKTFSNYEGRWLYLAVLTGHMYDDLEYYKNKIIPIIRSFNSYVNYRLIPEQTTIRITIRSRLIFDFLKELGMPVGEKKGQLRITKEMFGSPNVVKAAILRGLLDTDGHIFARKDEDYKYLHLEITSADDRFRKDIIKLIGEFGLRAYEHDTNVLIRGNANVRHWMKAIGSSHPVHIKRYNRWLNTGKLLPKRALSQMV